MKGSEVMKKLSVLWLLLLLVGCGNASSSLEGEWLGTDKNGGGGRVTFNGKRQIAPTCFPGGAIVMLSM